MGELTIQNQSSCSKKRRTVTSLHIHEKPSSLSLGSGGGAATSSSSPLGGSPTTMSPKNSGRKGKGACSAAAGTTAAMGIQHGNLSGGCCSAGDRPLSIAGGCCATASAPNSSVHVALQQAANKFIPPSQESTMRRVYPQVFAPPYIVQTQQQLGSELHYTPLPHPTQCSCPTKSMPSPKLRSFTLQERLSTNCTVPSHHCRQPILMLRFLVTMVPKYWFTHVSLANNGREVVCCPCLDLLQQTINAVGDLPAVTSASVGENVPQQQHVTQQQQGGDGTNVNNNSNTTPPQKRFSCQVVGWEPLKHDGGPTNCKFVAHIAATPTDLLAMMTALHKKICFGDNGFWTLRTEQEVKLVESELKPIRSLKNRSKKHQRSGLLPTTLFGLELMESTPEESILKEALQIFIPSEMVHHHHHNHHQQHQRLQHPATPQPQQQLHNYITDSSAASTSSVQSTTASMQPYAPTTSDSALPTTISSPVAPYQPAFGGWN